MAMVALDTPILIGPVPFKDVAGDDGGHTAVAYTETTYYSTYAMWPDAKLQQYQGMWRPDDVLLASPPKCGTTWLKALSFATMARAAYSLSDADHPLRRFNPHECIPVMENLFSAGQEAKLEALPSPRLLHTHMHYSLLPHSLADCKIIFVCREPKDMLVSMWHFLKSAGSNVSFSDLFEHACEGQNQYGPSWDHVLGYWNASKDRTDRVLFLRYEQMLAYTVGTVRQLAQFLGVPFTAAEEAAGSPVDIAEMCSIDTLRGLALRGLDAKKIGNNEPSGKFRHQTFFRKGVVGDWVNHMTPEMARRMDAIVEDKLRGSGLTFTSVPTVT